MFFRRKLTLTAKDAWSVVEILAQDAPPPGGNIWVWCIWQEWKVLPQSPNRWGGGNRRMGYQHKRNIFGGQGLLLFHIRLWVVKVIWTGSRTVGVNTLRHWLGRSVITSGIRPSPDPGLVVSYTMMAPAIPTFWCCNGWSYAVVGLYSEWGVLLRLEGVRHQQEVLPQVNARAVGIPVGS